MYTNYFFYRSLQDLQDVRMLYGALGCPSCTGPPVEPVLGRENISPYKNINILWVGVLRMRQVFDSLFDNKVKYCSPSDNLVVLLGKTTLVFSAELN